MMDTIVGEIQANADRLGFTQGGDLETAGFIGALVKLARPHRVLELGTGLGLTTSHILAHLGAEAQFDSVERDAALAAAAAATLPSDARLRIHVTDGEAFIASAVPDTYDFVFADTWPGKYRMLAETLALVKPKGLYVVDDMEPKEGWTPEHAARARSLLEDLSDAEGWRFVTLPFGTGLALGVRM